MFWCAGGGLPLKCGTGNSIRASFSLCLWLVTVQMPVGLCILDFCVQRGNDFVLHNLFILCDYTAGGTMVMKWLIKQS